MRRKRALITGSSGLVGSGVATFFEREGFEIHGVDNNQRAIFFGAGGDTRWNQARLEKHLPNFRHHEVDIRDRAAVMTLCAQTRPDVIVHAAAQPSHDKAAEIPFDDFDINAVGTLNLLEAARQHCPESPFIHMSSNKVYGDKPNSIAYKEAETRWDFDDVMFTNGIREDLSIDQSTHSLFGASKIAADLLVQEYGRYFHLPTCCLRSGCITGPYHAGVELHGFLSYLLKCNLEQSEYRIFGFLGKQVRDNIHVDDLAAFAFAFHQQPRIGEVYNLGGGKENSCSILEAFALAEELTGLPQRSTYVDRTRTGDHRIYYSDLRKMLEHYPGWKIQKGLKDIFTEIVNAWPRRGAR